MGCIDMYDGIMWKGLTTHFTVPMRLKRVDHVSCVCCTQEDVSQFIEDLQNKLLVR